jgi:hypothetical protein
MICLILESSSVVVSLQSKLANMSKSFKQVLEIRTENMKHQKERREHFSSQTPIVSSALPPRNAQGGALMSGSRQGNFILGMNKESKEVDRSQNWVAAPFPDNSSGEDGRHLQIMN